MKRNVALFAVLLFVSLSALGQSRQSRRFANPVLDDVVQMSRAELPEGTILAFLRARRARLETDVTADDLVRLRRAGVRDRIVEYIASVSGPENGPADLDREPEVTYDSRDTSAAPVDPGDSGDSEDSGDSDVEAYPEPYGSVYDGWGWGGYPYWYAYSPFFYGGIVIGRGAHFHRHHFDHDRGRSHGHGGNHSWRGGSSRGSGGRHGGASHGGGSHGGGGHR